MENTAPTAPLVSIVIANFNGCKYLDENIGSFLNLDYPKDRLEIIMVDNGSTDGSIEFVQTKFPMVKVIKNETNNYARANNLGIQEAKGEYIGFANNDVKVDENWLTQLINVIAKDGRIGVVGGKILLFDGKIQSVGLEEYPDFYWGDRGLKLEDKGQYERLEEVKAFGGSAVIYKKVCLDEIGLFDEDFQMYMEDVDMGLRCAQKKWKIIYVPTSIAWHHFRGTSTLDVVEFFSERNRLLVVAKHYPEQLNLALYGKGFFTGSDRDMHDILPLVLGKFIECHGFDRLKAALPSILESLRNISNLNHRLVLDRVEEYRNIIQKKEMTLDESKKVMDRLIETNAQLQKQLEEALEECTSKQKQLSVMEYDLRKAHEEVVSAQADLERMVRFDRKIKVLLIKPQRVSVDQTQEAARIIKKKYPNASVHVFANLVKGEYEQLLKNDDIEKNLMYGANGKSSPLKMLGLLKRLYTTKFDMAVSLLSRGKDKAYKGYQKAKLLGMLTKSRSVCNYYID